MFLTPNHICHNKIIQQESTRKYQEDPILYIIQSLHGPILYKIFKPELTMIYQEDLIQNIIQSAHGPILYKIIVQESTIKY